MSVPIRGVISKQRGSQETVKPGHYNNLRADVVQALSSVDHGNDSDKEASPGAGRVFVAQDVGKFYVALTPGGVWTDLSDIQNLTNENLYVLADGTRPLTGDWSFGGTRLIQGGKALITNSLIIPVSA